MAELTIQQAFDLAVQHHRAGRLSQAEQLCRQILLRQPQHVGALFYLGVLAKQAGRNEIAVELLRGAIAIKPDFSEAHNNLGIILNDIGQLDEAIAAYRQAIAHNPNYAEVHNNLGNALKDKGQFDEAVAAFRRAIDLKPNYPEAHFNLGIALNEAGKLDESIVAYRQAIALNPNFPQAHNNLGIALKDKGQLDEAIASYRQAIALNPDYAEARCNLGIALHDKGQPIEAIAAYRHALAINPNYAEAHNHLGMALNGVGQHDESIAAFRQAIALNPDYPEAHKNLGIALNAKGQFDQAIAAFGQAIRLKPNFAGAYNNLGAILEQEGDFQEAERCYRQSIHLCEKDPLAHAKLAKLLGRNLPDKDLLALKALLAEPSSDILGRSHLHFAAAHVLDERECYPEAAEYLRLGNALCKAQAERTGKSYDAAAHEQFVGRMIDVCSAEFFQRVQTMGVATQRPVFIIGLPRSGTTLTEQILAAHSRVFAAGELPFAYIDFLSLAGESAQTLSQHIKEDLALQSLGRLNQQTIQQVARLHLRQLDKLNSSAARIVDKMPENYLVLGLLAALFPQATFIHCRRDLRDVAVSCWMTRFENPWTSDLELITTRIEQYRRLMRHWGAVLDGRWLDCDYEQTVADLPETAHRLVAWCGLEWEPACVDFHRVKRPVRTPSATQVRQPIFNRSVGRWKHYQEFLAPVLARLS